MKAGAHLQHVAAPAGRLAVVDIGRGLALCGMALFHLDWDLAFLHWRDTGPESSTAWMVFGHTVAGSFLALSGFSLVLAEPKGMAAALRRLALLTGAALAVTVVTRWLFPSDYIFFGILHCIALSNLLALVVLRVPVPLLLLGAGLAAVAPLVAASAGFDGPAWWWLGLSKGWPSTLDYRPLLPWLGCVLLGVAAARLLLPLPRWTALPPIGRGLAWAGRHSLALYLIHQPVLLGALLLVGTMHPVTQGETAASLLGACRSQCEAAGGGPEGCEAGCACLRQSPAGLGRSGGPLTLHSPPRDPGLYAQTACSDPAIPAPAPATASAPAK